jgi:hypothetical protein
MVEGEGLTAAGTVWLRGGVRARCICLVITMSVCALCFGPNQRRRQLSVRKRHVVL